MANKLKVMTILGTRPEIIRLSRTMANLDKHVDHVIVHTGQNYDFELNEIFWKQMELRRPDHFLNVDTSSLGAAVGDIMRKSQEVMKAEQPDAVLVLGDTNSCLAAYMAKRMHIPIFHMEAGNRSFDFNVPEEINRRIIDHISDFNLVYTEHARRHLISEGLPHRRIYLTGSPMKEVLDYYRPKIDNSDILSQLDLLPGLRQGYGLQSPQPSAAVASAKVAAPRTFFLVSVHREENVDNPENLNKIITILNTLAEEYNVPVIVSTHPRTRKRIETPLSTGTPLSLRDIPPEGGINSGQKGDSVVPDARIQFLKPFGFLDYVKLQMNALCTISDSGTISEESSILSFPAISLRNSMERPEAQDAGTIILTGFNPDVVMQSVRYVMDEYKNGARSTPAAEYLIDDTSNRVVKLILGNTRLSNLWHGIR